MDLGQVLDQRHGTWPFLPHSVRQIQASSLAVQSEENNSLYSMLNMRCGGGLPESIFKKKQLG